eukprot:jgi/Tetstr1/421998/TSEL_001242.t1
MGSLVFSELLELYKDRVYDANIASAAKTTARQRFGGALIRRNDRDRDGGGGGSRENFKTTRPGRVAVAPRATFAKDATKDSNTGPAIGDINRALQIRQLKTSEELRRAPLPYDVITDILDDLATLPMTTPGYGTILHKALLRRFIAYHDAAFRAAPAAKQPERLWALPPGDKATPPLTWNASPLGD